MQAQVPGTIGPISGPGSTENVGEFQGGSHRRFSRRGCCPPSPV
jgi:hypothetical protein